MKRPQIIALALLAAMPMKGLADIPAAPRPWVATSEGGNFFFKMVPPKRKKDGDKYVIEREPFGVAYEISEDGEFKEVWRTEGWYTFEGYLSEDGRYFVRIGPWASDQENHTDLAIAFYDFGKLLKEYQVKELIRKPDLLEDSVSHYMWRPEIQSEPNGFYGGTFHLVMIDKTSYSFDYETGEIIIQEKDNKAKSSREIWAEEQAAANNRGQELYEASPFKEEFEPHFEITRMEAMLGSFSSCSLEGPAWVAEFTPKQKFEHEARVRPVFPIRDDSRVVVSLTPQEITSAFEQAFKHPFVSKRFKDGGATGVRLRIQGDRLHWNTPELQEFVEKITGKMPKEDELRHWAYFIIDDKNGNCTSIYFNTKTSEIIDEDESKWPSEHYLIDSNGNRQNANNKGCCQGEERARGRHP
ncbi:MAG: hypothetical protein JNK37_09400 [Verrucomicrobiales bacterium]|nr:hypothetical protein [Verrucomicrobiales bacterium]